MKFKSNPVMNGSKSDVPDLTTNEVGDKLRLELLALPHVTKDFEAWLTTPVKVKVLSFMLERGMEWKEYIVTIVSNSCFVNNRSEGKAWWTITDYKL